MGTVDEIAGKIWDIWQQYSDEERCKIAHAKRFLECHSGDDEFRAMLHGNPGDAKNYLVEHGCSANPDEMRPLWDNSRESFQIDGQIEH